MLNVLTKSLCLISCVSIPFDDGNLISWASKRGCVISRGIYRFSAQEARFCILSLESGGALVNTLGDNWYLNKLI